MRTRLAACFFLIFFNEVSIMDKTVPAGAAMLLDFIAKTTSCRFGFRLRGRGIFRTA